MFLKSLFAVAAIASTVAVAAPAQAKVYIDLNLGGGYYDQGYPVYQDYPTYPVYDEPVRRYRDYGISCDEGREMVRDQGYRKVRAISCNGRRYTYRARSHGENFIVKVSRRDGDIISVEPAY